MRKLVILLFLVLVCVSGCKKDPHKEQVDKMFKEAQDAGVPVSREQIEQMIKQSESTVMTGKRTCDFGLFLSAVESKDYEKAYSFFNEESKNLWAKEDFIKDMSRLVDDIAEKWEPDQMEYMDYQTANGPVSTSVYLLTDEFQSPYTMSLVGSNKDSGLVIQNVNLVFPYKGDDSSEFEAKAMEFLNTIYDLDVEKNRTIMAQEYREYIQLSVLQQTKDMLWDNSNNAKTISEAKVNISNGRSVCLVLADSQIYPMMKLKILLEKHDDQIQVVGFHQEGRVKVN